MQRGQDFVYHRGMPLIRPGLYHGSYNKMYGKFQSEILLVEYRRFKLPSNPGGHSTQPPSHAFDRQSAARDLVWAKIDVEIFGAAHGQYSVSRL